MRATFNALLLLVSAASLGQPLPAPAQKVTLSELTRMNLDRSEAFKQQPFQWSRVTPLIEKQWRRLDTLVRQDKLVTGGDFYVASQLADDPTGWFEQRQKQHELALTALLLGEPNAPLLVARTWDWLMMSLGRDQRFGTIQGFDMATGKPAPPVVDPAAIPTLKALLLDPTARTSALAEKDNTELQEIRAADQKAREFDFSKVTPQELQEMAKTDVGRRARALEMLRAGLAKTPKDYEAVALVMQHGDGPASFALAHELSIISMALGTKDAAWLVSRSYDRFLLRLGHRQRYGTNASQAGLSPVSEWMNDRMRKLAVVKTLAEQRAWGDSFRRQSGGG